jgi:hypothetical protein
MSFSNSTFHSTPAAPTAKPGCPDKHRGIVERKMASFPLAWRAVPQNNEIFDSLEQCEERLRAYAFCEGFDIVRKGGGTPTNPGSGFVCIHHGKETRNYRKLENKVEKDLEDNIVSLRKRDGTLTRQLDCEWEVRCTFKDYPRRGSGIKKWILTLKSKPNFDPLAHSHLLVDDPLVFPAHKQSTTEYQEQIVQARVHREKVLPYSDSRRVLEDSEYGLMISPRKYYNQIRKQKFDQNEPRMIDGLVASLQLAGFIFRRRVKEEIDGTGEVVGRKLEQIFFAHRRQLEIARRFVSGFLLVIDGTFNTNEYRLPLLIMVRVLNTGMTFPVAFSFCRSESRTVFEFVWESLRKECFTPEIPPPGVITGDWAAGLIASHPRSFPGCQLQGCNWHAVEAMQRKFYKEYTKNEVEGYSNKRGEKVDDLRDLAWKYIKSMSQKELQINR